MFERRTSEKICVISGSVLRHGIGALAAVRRRRAFRGGRIHTCTGDHACGNALDAQRAGGSGRYGASSADNVAASAVVYSLPRGVKLRALGATGAAGTLPGGLIIGTAPSLAAVFVGGGEHTQEPRGERRAATRKKKIQDVGLRIDKALAHNHHAQHHAQHCRPAMRAATPRGASASRSSVLGPARRPRPHRAAAARGVTDAPQKVG